MKQLKLISLMIWIIVSAASVSLAEESKGFERVGNFDLSTEDLAKRFSVLKRGMSLSDVKKNFPDHVKWSLWSIDRHYAQEYCFQWQNGVFFVFSFKNLRPFIKQKPNIPDDYSGDWALAGVSVLKARTKVEDGRDVTIKVFEKPRITYKLPSKM